MVWGDSLIILNYGYFFNFIKCVYDLVFYYILIEMKVRGYGDIDVFVLVEKFYIYIFGRCSVKEVE